MRTKIGKRIGPVPIALVAVLALAAFISAGLWLVPSGGAVTHAQGLPEAQATPPMTGDTGVGGSGCGITLDGDTDDQETINLGDQDAYVAGGKCSLSGDSIDVVFENTDEEDTLPLVVYTTGGDDFPSVQALVPDGGDADMIDDAAGEVGVDEHLLTIPKQTNDFGVEVRGAKTITVTRSMAGDDGRVYLFGYFSGDDTGGAEQQFLISGMFDVNRDGVISGDDDRGTNANATPSNAQIIDGKFNVVGDPDVVDDDDDTDGVELDATGYVIVDGVMYVVSMAVDGAPPVALGMNTATSPGPIMLVDGKADLDGDGSASGARAGTLTGDFNSDDDLATVQIINGGFNVDGDINIDTDDSYDGSQYVIREGAVYTRMDNTGPAPVSLGASPEGTPGGATDNPDMWARNSAYHVPFAPNTENFFPRVFTNDSGDPTGTGINADIVVLVRFQDPPALKSSDGKTTLSKVTGTPVNSDGVSTVTVTIKDANGVGLTGFANLAIDADAGEKVLFSDSSLKSHRIEIKNGIGSTVVKGLPKTGAVRVKVTATFGDFEVSGDLKRLSRAAMLDVETYSCVTRVGNLDVPPSDTCRIEAGTKADDLTEATSFAPGEMFLVVGTLKDTAGNTLDKRLSASQLQPSGTTKAISLLANVTAASKEDATSNSLEYPAVTSVHANSRMYATVDKNEANAQLGSYDIEVSGDGQKMTVTVTIAGEVSQISVDGPEMIPAESGVGTFTVKATDANGNVPTNVGPNVAQADSNFEALVSVRPTTSKVLGTDEGKFTFNAKTGEATFFVQVADDAEVGDSLTITVTAIGDSSIAPVTMTVTYGGVDDTTDPGMTDTMDELTAPTGVVVSVLQDTISVTWTKDPNAEQTKVVVFNADVTSIEYIETVNAANDDGSHTFTDVASGTYKVTVASFRTGESHKLSTPLQTVTIE